MNKGILFTAMLLAVAIACAIGAFVHSSRSAGLTMETTADEATRYVESKHPETAQFTKSLAWSGGRATNPSIVGAETYEYAAEG